MKKNNLFVFILPLIFFFSLTATIEAAEITYQPSWKAGERFQYDTTATLAYSQNSSSPFSLKIDFRQNFEVLSVSSETTELALSFAGFVYEDSFQKRPTPLFTEKREQQLIQNFVIKYQVDSTGAITKITNMDELVSLYYQLAPSLKPIDSKKQYWVELIIELMANLIINYSNYSALPLHLQHGPHHALYLNKTFTDNGSMVANPITFHQPPLYPLTFHDIRLQLDGSSQMESFSGHEGSYHKITSRYSFDKADQKRWGQTILDRWMLTPEARKSFQRSFDFAMDDYLVDLEGTFTDVFQTTSGQNLPTQNESTLHVAFSYQKPTYDSKTSSYERQIETGSVTLTFLSKLVK